MGTLKKWWLILLYTTMLILRIRVSPKKGGKNFKIWNFDSRSEISFERRVEYISDINISVMGTLKKLRVIVPVGYPIISFVFILLWTDKIDKWTKWRRCQWILQIWTNAILMRRPGNLMNDNLFQFQNSFWRFKLEIPFGDSTWRGV